MSDHEHYASDIYVNPEDAGGAFGYLPGVLANLGMAASPDPLDVECACAYGRDDLSPAPDCGQCQGSGYVLTDAGRALLAFLQRHPPALTRTHQAREDG